MLTIFSCPKPFKCLTDIIQRNAVESWLLLKPSPEIILVHDEQGTKDVCDELNIKHIPNIEKNEYGTPLMSSIFSEAQKAAKNKYVCYVNADIILMNDFVAGVEKVIQCMPECLIIGRRWNLDIDKKIDFSEGWENKLNLSVSSNGKLHGQWGIDYLVFPKDVLKMPPFAVGRVMWDNWFIYNTRSLNIPVVDITPSVTVVHQNHDHAFNNRFGDYRNGAEAKRNLMLAGGYGYSYSIHNATHKLGKNGIKRNLSLSRFYWEFNRLMKRLFAKLYA